MALYSEDLCCSISSAIIAEESCTKLPGGIEDVRIGCLKYFSAYTEVADDAVSAPGTVSAITALDPADGISAIVPFYKIGIRKLTGEHEFGLTYDEDSDTVKKSGSLNFEVTARDDSTRVAMREYIGQEVVMAFKYRGSDEWYLEGWKGGLRVQSIVGGSGLDSARNTAFEISGDDLDEMFVRFFNTDASTTESAIDALTN